MLKAIAEEETDQTALAALADERLRAKSELIRDARPIMVPVSSRPGFHGPVVLLTSADSNSEAETFAMALFGRTP